MKKYVIAGTGPAGVVAAETLRKLDSNSQISLLGAEPEQPYSRMALPYLLEQNIDEAGTYLRHAPQHFQRHGIELHQARLASIDVQQKSVSTEDGKAFAYDKLLLATGSHTLRPPIPGRELPGVENCWTLADARRIASRLKPGAEVVLMGAGFIGCIVLQALAARRVNLTVIEMADRMLARMMDECGGELMRRWCEQHGIKVLTATKVEAIEAAQNGLQLKLSSGATVAADLAVCATGVAPNMDFLQGAGVSTDAGILVDQYLQTNVSDIYAAGDVAQGPELLTGNNEVHAIQPTASEHGRIAAQNMAGQRARFAGSLSMNVLNTLGLVTSSFGLWAGKAGGDRATVLDKQRFKYLRLEFAGDHLIGALAMGLTQHVGIIRGLIQTRVPLGPWKDKLMHDPHQLMNAYLDRVQGKAAAS